MQRAFVRLLPRWPTSLLLCDPHLTFSPNIGVILWLLRRSSSSTCHICHWRSLGHVAPGLKFNLLPIWCNCFERRPYPPRATPTPFFFVKTNTYQCVYVDNSLPRLCHRCMSNTGGSVAVWLISRRGSRSVAQPHVQSSLFSNTWWPLTRRRPLSHWFPTGSRVTDGKGQRKEKTQCVLEHDQLEVLSWTASC